jgi:predicted metal-dependent hydrolase
MAYTNKVQLSEVGRFDVTLNGQLISYTLKRSSRARLVWLKINRNASLTVTVPQHYDIGHLPQFLVAKADWIIKHLNRLQLSFTSTLESGPPLTAPICYLGKPLTISDFRISNGIAESGFSKEKMVTWLKGESVRVLNARTEQIGRQIGVSINSIRVRDQRSRWGSCSCHKNLSFNWRLIMAPEPILDYVVIHELCHLKEMSHSRVFWGLVAIYCPDWRERRKWLNKHSSELNSCLNI